MRDGFCLIKLRECFRAMRFLLLILRCVLAFHGSHPSLNRTQHDCYEVVSQKYSSENAPSDSLREASTNAPYVAHDRLGENVAELSKIEKELACASPKFWMAPRVGFEPTTYRLTAECSAVELPRNEMVGVIRFELMTSSV